ncbi:MAG: hypothetical protein ABIL86_00145 [candidate division WOR-3 bacterium]
MILLTLYGLNIPRQRWLKRRLKDNINLNLKATAENISLMLLPAKKVIVRGDTALLKKGAILYSIHFGTWELMPKILKTHLHDREIGILVERYTQTNPWWVGKFLDRIFYYLRNSPKIKIFYPDEIFKIVDFIKKAGIFSVLVDGDNPFAKLEKIKRLAHLCCVPLIPFAVYHENGTHILEIGCDLKQLLRERSADYWWFYKSRRHYFYG